MLPAGHDSADALLHARGYVDLIIPRGGKGLIDYDNHMATLGVTTMSAESKTEPGGYYSYPQTLEQFHINDDRKAVEVERDLRKLGREPVWKDWDQSFDNLKRV